MTARRKPKTFKRAPRAGGRIFAAPSPGVASIAFADARWRKWRFVVKVQG